MPFGKTTVEETALEKLIALFVILILTVVFGGALARVFQRPDIADLIGNSIMGLLGLIILFIGGCYGVACLKFRYILKKSPVQDTSDEPSTDGRNCETRPEKNP